LHSIKLDASASQQDACWRLLNRDEKALADRFRFPQLSSRWITARAGLKQVLSHYCSSSPEHLRFDHERYGKPVLAELNLHFNLSHSHDLALVVVTRAAPVGVDLEYQRPLPDWQDIAEFCFSPSEYRQLLMLSEAQRQTAFYCCWTRKEAVAKATGEGLSARLKSFDVSLVPGEPAAVISDIQPGPFAGPWQLEHLDVADGFVGAVALQCSQDVVIEDHGPWRIGEA